VAAVIFSVQNGSFSYKKRGRPGKEVLRDVTFSAGSGELVAILGPNGAGKTTLLRCMMGFLPWQGGGSFLDGDNIRRLPVRHLWRRMAYVPQARGLASGSTVFEMVLLGRSSRFSLLSQPGRADKEAASKALADLGISHLADRLCSQLSGGELQMVLIARALAAEPELLILDEPESNLDFKNQLIILDTLSRLTAGGLCCIFNTHYPAHALQRAHKAFLLGRDGNWTFGETQAVITEQNLADAFGVATIIGEIETPHHIVRDVLPLEVIDDGGPTWGVALEAAPEEKKEDDSMETRIAIIGIIVEDRAAAEQINELLHGYSDYVVGRMGMPYEKKKLSIISVIVDAPEDVISSLSGKLGMVRGISVKTTYSKK